MKKLAYLVIVLGMAVLFYPTGKHFYEDYQQRKLLESWTTTDSAGAAGDANALEIANGRLSEALAAGENPQTLAPSNAVQNEPKNAASTEAGQVKAPLPAPAVQKNVSSAASGKTDPPVWGLLRIERIGVKLPVLEGVTMQNMNYAAAHMPGTAKPGETGNSAIAAHHSYTYGRLFNRLGELQPGDEVKLSYGGQTYTYRVTVNKTVEPDDLSVLNKDGKRKMLTLITCDDNGTRRVIIQAELKS